MKDAKHCPGCGTPMNMTVTKNRRLKLILHSGKCGKCRTAWQIKEIPWYKTAFLLSLALCAPGGAATIDTMEDLGNTVRLAAGRSATNSTGGTLTNFSAVVTSVLLTNWTDTGRTSTTLLWWNGQGEDPNITTHYDQGTVTSNRVALLHTGQTVTLESKLIGYVSRAWTWSRPVRQYGAESFTPVYVWETNVWATNAGVHAGAGIRLTTNGTNITLTFTNSPKSEWSTNKMHLLTEDEWLRIQMLFRTNDDQTNWRRITNR